MKSLNSLADIKDAAQVMDTSIVQWINSDPPEHIQNKLTEARGLLQRGIELADAPLRIALVGEFNSGKTLLLNSLLDSTDIFPCLLQPTTGNVLEVKVNLMREERPARIRKAQVSFFNQFEIEDVLQHYVKNLQNHEISGVPSKVTLQDLDQFEQFIVKKFGELRSITPKYALISALEFVTALKNCREIVEREQRHSCTLPMDLIAASLTLSKRPDLSKGIQAQQQKLSQMYQKARKQNYEKVTSVNLKALFPIVRRVEVEVSAWCVPFGISPEEQKTLAFLDFPGLGAEGSSARDEYLCMREINDAHAVLVVFNGSNPGTAGASTMANLFQKVGKLTTDRTIVAVNRFDEFSPLPADRTVESYYSSEEQGTTVGFSTILIPAKNLIQSKRSKLYVCSALCYLFDEKSKRPNWNFGNATWFNDNKRQAAYTLYKRSSEDFQKLISAVGKATMLQDHQHMKDSLQRYLEGGGVPTLRQDLTRFTVERGERLIKEDALKEIRAAQRILDEIAPAAAEDGERSVNSELGFAAQEFYRVLELTVADTLPSGPSDYKKLKLKRAEEDVTLWELIESEIAASITSWPEWFAILNQGITNKPSRGKTDKPKRFGRYAHIKKQGGEVPKEFKAFDDRFTATAESLTEFTIEKINEAITYSLQRFENHPDYRAAIEHLQSMIMVNKLSDMEEAMPLLDVWTPSSMAEEEIVPSVNEEIKDEIDALKNMSYPYDASKPCFWNIALIIRVQVQLMKTYRDRLSRLVAAAENNFQDFYCNEVLRANILPLVRSSLNNPDFLGEVALAEAGSTWETVGQVVRHSVTDFKNMSSAPVVAGAAAGAAKTQDEEEDMGAAQEEEHQEEAPEEQPQSSAPEKKDYAPEIVNDEEDAGEIIDEDEFEEW